MTIDCRLQTENVPIDGQSSKEHTWHTTMYTAEEICSTSQTDTSRFIAIQTNSTHNKNM